MNDSDAYRVKAPQISDCEVILRKTGQLTRLDLSDGSSGKLVFGVLSDVDVACQLCSAALVDDVRYDFRVADDGCVLLARADGGAISGKGCVDLEANASVRAGNALNGQNDAVSVGQ